MGSSKVGNPIALDMLERMLPTLAKELRVLKEKKQLEAIGIVLGEQTYKVIRLARLKSTSASISDFKRFSQP